MRASIRTCVTLLEFCEWLGMHPYFFAQIGQNVPSRTAPQCRVPTFQEIWQNSEILAREEFAIALERAENMIANVIGYYPAPKYLAGEYTYYPRDFNRGVYGLMLTGRGQYKSVPMRYGKIQDVGVETLTLVDNDVNVVYSDDDGDTVLDHFTITVTVPSGTLKSEIRAYFVEADRDNLSQAQAEIRPLTVSIVGTTATIKGIAPLMVIPNLQTPLNPDNLSATDSTIYADTVDIYRSQTDASQAGSLVWEQVYSRHCESSPCDVCIESACFIARDKEQGLIAPVPSTYDATLQQFVHSCVDFRAPDRVIVNYLAGLPREDNGRVNTNMRTIVCMLATALLPKETCACEKATGRVQYYRDPPKDKEAILLPPQTALNPFNSLARGAIEAWGMLLAGNYLHLGATSFGY